MNDKMNLNHKAENIRKPSWVPVPLAALFSLIIPGLGQIFARSIRRGILLFFSYATILGLLVWRFILAAPRDEGFADIVKKGWHLDPFLIIITILFILLHLWIVYDAYLLAKHRDRTPLSVFFVILVVFFALGWQIGQIDLVNMVTQADEALPALSRIAWPWIKAIEYDEDEIRAVANIEVPCPEDHDPPAANEVGNDPVIVTDLTCGILKEQDGTLGTILRLEGHNFIPGVDVNIMWADPINNEFRQRQGGEYVILIPDENGYFEFDIEMPYRLLPPSANEPTYIWELFALQIAAVGDAHLSQDFILVVEKMIETIFIGMMATFFGVIFALPVSFFAARNLMSASPVTLVIYYLVRGVLNIIRSIEPIIWAISAVIVVGLGPFAGILALVFHSIAALGKLYSEAIESIDPGPIEAIHATGANWVQTVIYAVIPQIIPPFVSFTIYRWDINVRMSTIIGLVGGGGIGFLLVQFIRILDYRSAGMCVWFIAITVAILDYVSAEIRARFV
ncbi:MAG: phosphonate ABC transporter, permease protein PhnE [Anaerolineales bacterium]|nr:phosphonate ABC transporter, permease protein PhnE [Anaerolineales bacterium]